jgi:hypothetical protein
MKVVDDALKLAKSLAGHGTHEQVAEVDAGILLPHRLLSHLRTARSDENTQTAGGCVLLLASGGWRQKGKRC